MTVVDNVLLGPRARRAQYARNARRSSQRLADDYGLPLDPYARIEDLSVGERQRVEIVKCLIREPSLFVLDEPTAVLLPDEIAALLDVCRRVAASGRAVVLVTHKLAEIKKVADRVTVLRGGRVVGDVSDRPAGDIDALVRAMIQGNVETLDTSAASILGGSSRVTACRATRRTANAGQDRSPADRRAHGEGPSRRHAARQFHAQRRTAARSSASPASKATARANLTAVLSGMMAATEGRHSSRRNRI